MKAFCAVVFLLVASCAICAEQWDAGKTYSTAGTIVEFEGNLYENHWWTKGDSPADYAGNPWHVWRPVEDQPDPGPEPDPEPEPPTVPDGSAWSPTRVYAEAGCVVVHNGKNWKNQWWTQCDEPGTGGELGVWRLTEDEPNQQGFDPDPDPPQFDLYADGLLGFMR